jgi:branched-chain amino acid transport system substrate-binding protein
MLSKIRADPPALIINTDYIPSNEAAFMEQFLENPTNSHMFIQYGPSTPEFVDLLGDKCTGVLYNSPNIGIYTSGNVIGNELLERGTDRFGFEPAGYTFTVYNEMWIYKQGCEFAYRTYGIDPADGEDARLKIAEVISKETAYMGTGAPMVFDSTYCLDGKYAIPTIYQLWEGERYTVVPDEYANNEVRLPPWWNEG